VPRHRGGDRRRRAHHQYPRYRRLQPPDQFGDLIRSSSSACPTPTRRCSRCIATTTWAWRGQLPVGGDERRAPGGVHHQRPGRARRQRRAGGDRHGGAHAPGRVPLQTDLDTTQIVTCSRLVSGITGFPVQPNKAIVGANAFAHESGIHQDGVLKSRETYEIMRAEDVGWTANRMVLGKHSGRNAFKTRLKELGIEFASEEALNAAFRPLQGSGRQEARDLRRRPAGPGDRGQPGDRQRAYQAGGPEGLLRDRRDPNADVTLAVDGEEQRASAPAAARWMPPSRHRVHRATAAPCCSSTRSTTSPAAPMPRAR
jgi:hypothetical protein